MKGLSNSYIYLGVMGSRAQNLPERIIICPFLGQTGEGQKRKRVNSKIKNLILKVFQGQRSKYQ